MRRKRCIDMNKSLAALVLVLLFCSGTIFALANPSAVYCNEMNSRFGGYKYSVQTDANSNERGVCMLPDGSQCDAWASWTANAGRTFPTARRTDMG